jgi:hypothetical protein
VIRRALRWTRTALRWTRRALVGALGLVALALLGANLFLAPRDDRDWEPDWERVPRARLDGDRVTIESFRDFRWEAASRPAEATWRAETFDLRELAAADFMVVPLDPESRAAAHTMLSFEFRGTTSSRYAVVSMEARRERDEPYATWRGLFNAYELAYVIGSEEDLVDLRARIRGNEVYRFPVNATPENLRALFANMALTADRIADDPEFYGTLWNSCTTRIAMHVREATGADVPVSWRYVLPGFSGELAYDLGWIGDGETPFPALEAKARIGQKARDAYGDPAYSARIRE